MNVLGIALTQIQNLVANQKISITNTTESIVDGVARPLAGNTIECFAQIQPLSPQELRIAGDGAVSSQEYYKIWIIGEDVELANKALNSNKNAIITWNNKEFFCYSKQDWSLNGWIEIVVALRGLSND